MEDVHYAVTSPSRWQNNDWQTLGWASLAVVGTAIAIDRPLRDAMRRHTGDNTAIIQVERFGAEYAALTVGSFYLGGVLFNDDQAVQVAQDALAASLIASGLVTPSLKLLAGRSRPRESDDIYYFKPFNNANASFPSGHTTEAFTLAAVISEHYNNAGVACTSYGIASLVGLARSYHAAHYASDILAGAMIGTLIGKQVVGHNRNLRAGRTAWLPDITPNGVGIRLVSNF